MPRYIPGAPDRTINFRLPVELYDRLKAEAELDERSMNGMAVRLLGEAFEARDAKARRRRAKEAATA